MRRCSYLLVLVLFISSAFVFAEHAAHHAAMRGDAGPETSIWKECYAQKQPPTDVPTAAQMAVIASPDFMASHQHRIAHALWHTMRSDLTQDDVKTVLSTYGPWWNNPHKMCPNPTLDSRAANYNPYGEDFLFMHHEMVRGIQKALMAKGLPCIAPWKSIPAPNDTAWPVPDKVQKGVKSDAAWNVMHDWQTAFQDKEWLKRHSLSQVGLYLELTLHNNMHMRWATENPPFGFNGGADLPLDNKFPKLWPFDDPRYNWLADPYGAHVNPHFWKLHGLVDQIVDRWLDAHGYETISVNCGGDPKCYTWRGTWTGMSMDHGAMNGQEMGTPKGSYSEVGHTPAELQKLRAVVDKRLADQRKGELTDSVLKRLHDEADSLKASHPKANGPTWANDPELFVEQNYGCGNSK